MNNLYWCEMKTPIGPLLLAGDAAALRRVGFQSGPRPLRPGAHWRQDPAPLAAARVQLEEYFAGTRREFTLSLRPEGTAFQLEVWQALRQIP